jgi:hypothetical protein
MPRFPDCRAAGRAARAWATQAGATPPAVRQKIVCTPIVPAAASGPSSRANRPVNVVRRQADNHPTLGGSLLGSTQCGVGAKSRHRGSCPNSFASSGDLQALHASKRLHLIPSGPSISRCGSCSGHHLSGQNAFVQATSCNSRSPGTTGCWKDTKSS